MLEVIMTILIWGLIGEGYYRLRRWLDGPRYRWKCKRCHMFQCAASTKNALELIKSAHTCDVLPQEI